MATLGAFILLATFVVCIYAAVVSIAGARRGSERWIDSGIGALYLTTALMTVARPNDTTVVRINRLFMAITAS